MCSSECSVVGCSPGVVWCVVVGVVRRSGCGVVVDVGVGCCSVCGV